MPAGGRASRGRRLPELSNVDIDRYFKGDPNYSPAISKNQISTNLDGKFTVVNMQDSDKGGGTHWVLLYDVRPDEVIWFDSMGQVPPRKAAAFMKQTGKTRIYNPLELQAMGSVV
jgi:hypothetical protein